MQFDASLVHAGTGWCRSSLVQFGAGAGWCSLMQVGASQCNSAQVGADWCSLVQVSADWCSLMQVGVSWCSQMQAGAVWCSLWRYLVQVGVVWLSLAQFSIVCCKFLHDRLKLSSETFYFPTLPWPLLFVSQTSLDDYHAYLSCILTCATHLQLVEVQLLTIIQMTTLPWIKDVKMNTFKPVSNGHLVNIEGGCLRE